MYTVDLTLHIRHAALKQALEHYEAPDQMFAKTVMDVLAHRFGRVQTQSCVRIGASIIVEAECSNGQSKLLNFSLEALAVMIRADLRQALPFLFSEFMIDNTCVTFSG